MLAALEIVHKAKFLGHVNGLIWFLYQLEIEIRTMQ